MTWGDKNDVRDIYQTESAIYRALFRLKFYQSIVDDKITKGKIASLEKFCRYVHIMSWFAIVGSYIVITFLTMELLEDR